MEYGINEFPSLDGNGSYGGNVNNKSQQFQDHYPGGSQSMMRPHSSDTQFRMQQKGSIGRGTVSNIAAEDIDGGGGGGNSQSGLNVAAQSPSLPPQFRALLPPFMQRGSDSALTGNENEGGSSPLPPSSAASHHVPSAMSNDSKNNNIVLNANNNGNNLMDSTKMSGNSGKRTNNNEGTGNSSSSFGTANTTTNVTKLSNQFPQKQSPAPLHSQQQQNNRIGGGNNFSSVPTGRGGRVVRGASGIGSNAVNEGSTERASGAGYNDNYQHANRRGGMNHQPRYANRSMTGASGGNYNNSVGHVRSDGGGGGGGGNLAGSGNAGSPSGFHEDSRNSHPPYGSGVLAEQEVVVRPIIRDEELQRLEAIAKDEGWAKDYEFDYNQKLEFSDDESEIDPAPPAAAKDKQATTGKGDTFEKSTTGAEKETDLEKVVRNNRGGQEHGGSIGHKEREPKQDPESSNSINVGGGMRGEGGVISVSIAAGGLDAAEAKERIKQRREEDQRREIERKQAAARKLQELEEKLSRKKNDESMDSKSGNIDKSNVYGASAGNVTAISNRMDEEKSVEGVAEHTSERTISIKIRGKSGERASVKEIRYDFGTGGGAGARHERDGGNLVGGGSSGNTWDLPGFSKTFQSNLPPRFQKRKLERNTSGTNLSTNANNTTSNQNVSRISNSSYTSSGTAGPASTSSGSEIKSTIPFAQQYDPRFIHNQQTYGRGIGANAMSNPRRSGTATSGASVRDRDERQRQHYDTRDTHNQRDATKEKTDTAEDNSRFGVAFGGGSQDSSSNQIKQNTGGRITPQLVRSLSESSNRKTSISSDENHHNAGHHSHHSSSSTHNSGSGVTKAGNYGREKSWDMEVEKGSSASSPASFSGSERHREIPVRYDSEQPKQILHRVKEITSENSDVIKDDKMAGTRIAKSEERELSQKDAGIESGEHALCDSAATLQDSKGSVASDVADTDGNSVDTTNAAAAAEKLNKIFQAEEMSSFGIAEATIKENMENDCTKDVAHIDNTHESRTLSGTDDKKQMAATGAAVNASSQQNIGKKKGVPLMQQQQQHPRDNRRHDTRGGSRGGSYSGGYHRADVTGSSSSSMRGGTSNWNRSRGGSRVGGMGSRNYNQDYWSESEFSEEGFDEQPKHHLHQKIYNHSTMGGGGAPSTDVGGAASKEGFVPRGEPSRRGRGGGNVGVVASSSNTANRQKQQHASFSGCGVSSMDGVGGMSKKMEGYGPPSSKSPFGGNSDDKNIKHRVGDSLSSNASATSPTRDDRDVQTRTRPISFTDAGKGAEDVLSSIDQEKLCAMVGDDKPNDESHSTEDNLASQKSGGRSSVTDNRMTMDSSDACDSNKAGTTMEDAKTKIKGIVTPATSKIGGSLAMQQHPKSVVTSLVGGSTNIANSNSSDSNLASTGNVRGGGNNHLVARKQQQSISRGQGAKLSSSDTLTDIPSGGSNVTQAVPTLMNINNSGSKAAANIVARPTTIPIEGERSSHLQQQQQQQQHSVTDKMAASSPVNKAKTDNDKHNLDGNTPPVNTIIFENTNYKSGVSVAALSGSSSSPVVGDCGGAGGDTNMNSLRRQQSGNSVTNFGSKVNTGLINEKMVVGAGGVVGALQSMASGATAHRPITSPTVTAANEGGLQHNIVGSSQRTGLSTGVPKQQQPCNMIASSLQGIPFQKSENDYKDIKSYAFETDISHLIDGDKGIKQQSSVSAGLCLSKSIEAEGGGGNHGVAVSVKNMISPSTADLNMKIASVKKVWEMPTVPEQVGPVVNTGSGNSANRVNVTNEHS
uniref:BAT2 N-terminal domain-containing protein n=1 Tax=Anopheles maculatus TaxID=74869 RepID=A0A182SPY1_9DIPT